MGENIAIRDAYGAALKELGEQNEKIVGLEADVASSTKSGIFGKAFPERYFNVGISELDIAKRLIDYGFHAPTMSFPVAGTLMVEPTESESKVELDRFINAMLAIRSEIDRVKGGEWTLEDNPLVNAPHTQNELVAEWNHGYTRELAVFPAGVVNKYWPTVKRLDDVYGDRNLFCSCVPMSEYQ